ncbi:MAG: hypothetical protein GYA58_08985 [Anaerolineaceae bacterium]|nr:hypothetical protein [Anaerolineaceae bacterium]
MSTSLQDYYKIEYQQVVSRIYAFETIRLQSGIFFGTANITALGFAFARKESGIFFIAALILSIYLFYEVRARKASQILYFRGLQLQRFLSNNDQEAFLEISRSAQAEEAKKILSFDDIKIRKKLLINSKTYRTGIFFIIPILVISLEVIAGILYLTIACWPLY